MDKVTLYIATHNITGKKYFGKTERFFSEDELQKYYHGSGTGWKQYLLEKGDDVSMEIYGIYNKEEVKEIALAFSKENNIVESSSWANRKEEDGFTGGKHSEETKLKISESKIGELNPLYGKKSWNYSLKMSDDFKKKISDSKKGCVPWNKNRNNLSRGFKHSEETRKLMSKNMTGIEKSESHKEKIRQFNLGKSHLEETKRKIGKALKRHVRPKDKCIYCNKEMDVSSLNRYHNEKCKNKGLI